MKTAIICEWCGFLHDEEVVEDYSVQCLCCGLYDVEVIEK